MGTLTTYCKRAQCTATTSYHYTTQPRSNDRSMAYIRHNVAKAIAIISNKYITRRIYLKMIRIRQFSWIERGSEVSNERVEAEKWE